MWPQLPTSPCGNEELGWNVFKDLHKSRCLSLTIHHDLHDWEPSQIYATLAAPNSVALKWATVASISDSSRLYKVEQKTSETKCWRLHKGFVPLSPEPCSLHWAQLSLWWQCSGGVGVGKLGQLYKVDESYLLKRLPWNTCKTLQRKIGYSRG